MEFEKVIRERFSVRKYKDEQIKEEQIQKILEAGNVALTAKNNQPQRIYVCQSPEAISTIDKVSRCRYNAPTVLVICGNKDEAFADPKSDYNSYEMDASIVATHMILEAYNVGVDSLWVLLFDKQLTKQELDLPENVEPCCLIMLGYRADDAKENPRHSQKKSLNDTVTFL